MTRIHRRTEQKKHLNDLDNHDGVLTHLEPDILECKVKWALGRITMNKANGGDGIEDEVFQILKDDAVKELQLVCQQIWKTQQWPQDSKMSIIILIPKKNECKKAQWLSEEALQIAEKEEKQKARVKGEDTPS